MPMRPVQPGWVIVPNDQAFTNEWYHLVGWTEYNGDPMPVIAMDLGVTTWRAQFGEDTYCVATLEEWCGRADNSS
jgi:hypothetical protein